LVVGAEGAGSCWPFPCAWAEGDGVAAGAAAEVVAAAGEVGIEAVGPDEQAARPKAATSASQRMFGATVATGCRYGCQLRARFSVQHRQARQAQ
jgi:hypothetical protein